MGYVVPMFCGFVLVVVSSLMFAFSRTYTMLLSARALNGLASAFTSVSGEWNIMSGLDFLILFNKS